MTERDLIELVPDGMTVAMVMTMVGRHHSSRPVTIADVRGERLSFLVARHVDWVTAIAGQQAIVHVTIADDHASTYLSLNGSAIVVTDPSETERLWSPAARAWFDGPDDPDLAVLHFDVAEGRFWDGPDGMLGRTVALVRGAITGSDNGMGTSGTVAGTGEVV